MTGGKIQASHPAVGRVSTALLDLQIRPMGSAVRDEKRFSLDKELQARPMNIPVRNGKGSHWTRNFRSSDQWAPLQRKFLVKMELQVWQIGIVWAKGKVLIRARTSCLANLNRCKETWGFIWLGNPGLTNSYRCKKKEGSHWMRFFWSDRRASSQKECVFHHTRKLIE